MDNQQGILINWSKQRELLNRTLPSNPTGADLVTLCHLSALDKIAQQQREIEYLRSGLEHYAADPVSGNHARFILQETFPNKEEQTDGR